MSILKLRLLKKPPNSGQCRINKPTNQIVPNKSKKKMSIEKVDVEIRFNLRSNQADKLINE